VWQELRAELAPLGLEIVTVALDLDADAARRWIAVAHPEHPSLIDQAHVVDELFGIVNVPSGIWINDAGIIVRPPETAYPRRPAFIDRPIPEDATPEQIARITAVKALRIDAETYIAALRDWARNGAESRYALAPEDVLRRSQPRSLEEATAAAHFELGQHLHRLGRPEDAIGHFSAAHRLQPANWTYKRQAWSLVDSAQGPNDVYEGDWLTDVQKAGAENYYAPLDME
jgi:tetratricopeptide (TPR) repeat protein